MISAVTAASGCVQHRTDQPENASALKFACRLFAYMTPRPYPAQDAFIQQCLVDGENSIWRQSAPKSDTKGMENDRITLHGNQDDGWGLAWFDGQRPVVTKSPDDAHRDPNFRCTALNAASRHPDLLLAHLREGLHPMDGNTHPFRLGRWVFMHNGVLRPRVVAQLDREIRRYHRQFGTPLPTGGTDTERVFLALMGRLQAATGIRNLEALNPPLDVVTDGFREMMGDLITACRQETTGCRGLLNRVKTWLGLMRHDFTHPVGLNFVLADSRRVLASCYGRKLFIGVRQSIEGAPEVLLASRPLQPAKDSGLQPITWAPVPERHILTLTRHTNRIDLELLRV